jgi:hypothetical protein
LVPNPRLCFFAVVPDFLFIFLVGLLLATRVSGDLGLDFAGAADRGLGWVGEGFGSGVVASVN